MTEIRECVSFDKVLFADDTALVFEFIEQNNRARKGVQVKEVECECKKNGFGGAWKGKGLHSRWGLR